MLNLDEIATRYHEMNEAGLMREAHDYDELIPEVQALLRSEFAERGLEPPLVEEPEEVEFRKLVTIHRYANLMEANIAQSLLESAGIESFLRDANVVRNDWFYANAIGGIRLDVDESNADAAREVLAQPIPESILTDDGSIYDQPQCPRCSSLDIRFEPVDQDVKLVALATLGLPIPGQRVDRWRCADCGAMWADDVDAPPEPLG